MDDSDSDWDSMTERDISVEQNQRNVINKQSAKKDTETSKKHGDNDLDSMNEPPHSFRSEVGATHSQSKSKTPGEPSKGDLYNPSVEGSHMNYGSMKKPRKTKQSVHEEDTQSCPIHNMKQQLIIESDDDPVYSTIKKTVSKKLPPIMEHYKAQKTPQPDKGFDNHAYEDNEQDSEIHDVNTESSIVVPNIQKKLIAQSVYDVDGGNIPYPSEKTVSLNRFLEKVFNYAALPFVVLSIFMQHLLRFVFVAVVKSLLLDPIAIAIQFLVEPFCSTILHPLLRLCHSIMVSIGSGFTGLFNPCIVLVKSFRLIDIKKESRQPMHIV